MQHGSASGSSGGLSTVAQQDDTKVNSQFAQAEPATADQSALASSVWSLLPDSKVDNMTTERTAGLVSITDTSAYGQNPYYNGSYTTGYGMYSSNPAAYYQVATGLRAQNAAAAAVTFPYGIGAAQTAYYGSSYPTTFNFNDYSTYNSQYCNRMQTASYYGNALTAGAYAGNNISSDSNSTSDISSFTIKDKKVSTKTSKKKKSGSCSPGDTQYTRVFIWDLDDICPLSSNTLTTIGHRATSHPHLGRQVMLLKQLTNRVIGLCFPTDHVEEFELCNVEDAALEDSLSDGAVLDGRSGVEVMRRLASKYFALRQLYQEFAPLKPDDACNTALIDRAGLSGQKDELIDAARQIDALYMQRSELARRCLDIVQQRSEASDTKYANVVICSDGLITGISELMLSSMTTSVGIDNVYSFGKTGKESVLERIQNRFGKKCSFVLITSNPETTMTAKKVSIPVWPMLSTADLEKFYSAQTHFLLTTTRQRS
ncbi:unnamed protein product [Auanema sp. JU1783]|nr:unnamed protein product [Auanema sp. JU1783]